MRRAPPTLHEAHKYTLGTVERLAPEDTQQNFGAWLMDCLMTEVVVQGGGRANVQYVLVFNSMYRRVAKVAAGANTAPVGTPYWHGNLAIEDTADAHIGNI